jgi:TM2 domain-containing membrane protein YozV
MSDPENQESGGLSADAKAMMAFESEKKSVGISYLLWFFLGGFGAHRFYLGRTQSAIAMLVIYILSWILTFVGVGLIGLAAIGIWWIVDAFLLPAMAREKNQALVQRIEAGSAA